jgi:hypothetical protein
MPFPAREEKACSASSEHICDEVPFPIPSPGKRITLVACVGCDGSFPKSLTVTPRKTIDTDIALTVLTDKKEAIYSQPKGFIDRSIFWS